MTRTVRAHDAMRDLSLAVGENRHAEGSCRIRMGDTLLLCTASLEPRVPLWLRGSGVGWVTAEYGMLPRATCTRSPRAAKASPSGRTHEIQRLIGRALRAVVDRKALGERCIIVDCDVLQADGGTRTAAITGGFVALRCAINRLLAQGVIAQDPVLEHVSAISCGLVDGRVLLDLDYEEDSAAEADANFAISESGGLVDIQASAEGRAFPAARLSDMLALAQKGCGTLVAVQRKALGHA